MMDIDSQGNVIDHDIFESVINVNERMTYTDVYKILEANDEELKERYKEFVETFESMKRSFIDSKRKRMRRGSVDFDFDETKIIIDEKGKISDIIRYKMTIANKIIEEFMLLCNEWFPSIFTGLEFPLYIEFTRILILKDGKP